MNSFFNPSLSLEAAMDKWAGLLSPLSPGTNAWSQAAEFLRALKAANENVRLISFHSDEELVLAHLADSLMALRASPNAIFDSLVRCIDVGAGGGFPSAPVRLARPGAAVTFLDSIQKKAKFLEDVIQRFSWTNCSALALRAEDAARLPEHRDAYDVAFCRAVGDFSVALELALPLLKPGGVFLAHRGEAGLQEMETARGVLTLLGAEGQGHHTYTLPHLDKPRHVLRVLKKTSTPAAYPRRAGMPAKRPLK